MEKEKIPSWDEIREMFAKNEERFARNEERAEKRAAEDKKRWAEADRLAAERAAEAAKRSAEIDRQLEKLGKKIDKAHKQIVGVSNNAGHHTEYYFQNALDKTKVFGGEKYDKLIRNLKFSGKESCEFDIFLVNGKSVAIIEAKSRIHPDFVEEMATKKTVQFRKYFPEYKDYKLRLGIAGFSFCDEVIEEAKKYGIGIIRQVGNSVELDDKNLKVY